MRLLLYSLILAFAFNFTLIAQVNKNKEKVVTNNWALGMMYTESGFGLSATYFTKLARTTDLTYKLSVSGVSDANEVEYYDYYYGNYYVKNKINRVYLTAFSVGLKHNVFFDDIEGSFKPFVKVGVSPALILFNPYEKDFFEAIKYTQTSYGFGGYAGIGIEYYESQSIGLSIGLDYYYIPVLGPDVYSLKDKKISNVGGAQIGFNFMFLK